MNLYPGSESCAVPLLDFYCWHCLHELSSSLWVMCSSSAWFLLLTLPAWTFIQTVSHVQLLCLISIADIACMNSYPGCESCAAPLLDFHCWPCLHELIPRMWVMWSSLVWFPLLTLFAWTLIQYVSHVQLLSLISTADIVCMNSHPGCESWAAPQLDFHCWHCLHELSSRVWVMGSSSAWFLLLILPVWTLIQNVSHGQLLSLISIADIACMNSYPESESWVAPLLDFHCWHCLNELLSRQWVMCSSSAWFPLLTLPAWTLIKTVSHVQLLCLISIADLACMNSHPGCESCAAPQLDFHFWHCLHELSSRLWVMCSSSAWFPLLTLPAWTLIQAVSHVQLLSLISIADIACINSYPGCESCAAPLLLFPLLKLFAWTLIQLVSHVQLLCLIFIADIACINSYPGCESCIAPLLNFHCQHCLYEFLSRKWVSVPLLNLSSAWFWLLIYYLVYCPVCSYFNALSFSHSVNTSTCHR